MEPHFDAAGVIDRHRVLVVVPAYNEERSLPTVLSDIRAALPGADVLVVDDGSTDATARVAAGRATVARLPFNVGVGGAVRTGFRYAAERGYDVVVQIDADGQHDPFQAPTLIAALDGSDVVVGTRFGTDEPDWVAGHRRMAMSMLASTVTGLVGTRVTDSTSGFRAHSRRAIRLFAEHYPTEYLGDTVESLVIAHRAGLRVSETPVRMQARTGGQASQGTASSVRYIARVLASTYLARIRSWPLAEEVVA